VIDLHCHVIPGVDDGPRTIEESVELCRAAAAAGTRTIVAMPHVNWDYPDVDAPTIHAGVVAVNAALEAARIDLVVRAGAEVALSRAGELSDGELGVLRLGRGRCLLVECPHTSVAAGLESALLALAGRGHTIVLAHPERSPVLQRHPEVVSKLVDIGMLCCVTAASLTGGNGRQARSFAWTLLGRGLVHALASDAHDVARRPPALRPELERGGLDPDEINHFARAVPEAIVGGSSLPPALAVTRGRGGLSSRRGGRR
jgi:protein-tyrosine phosphatase